MVEKDIQQKSQEEYKRKLDKILEIAEILPQAVAEYVFDGTIERYFPKNRKSVEIDIYVRGSARSQAPILESEGQKSYIGKVVYDFGGVVSIKDDKLKLELVRGRALRKEIYYNGEDEMKKYRYERQKNGLHYLRELSKIDEILPLAIQYLEERLHTKGIGERKRIDLEYDVSTGELRIKVCGDDIMESPEDIYRNILYSPIHYFQGPSERKCLVLEGKKGISGIWLNTNYIIEHKPYFLEKEQIPAVLDYKLSEKTLKQRYELE
jgi:hypothetical protein